MMLENDQKELGYKAFFSQGSLTSLVRQNAYLLGENGKHRWLLDVIQHCQSSDDIITLINELKKVIAAILNQSDSVFVKLPQYMPPNNDIDYVEIKDNNNKITKRIIHNTSAPQAQKNEMCSMPRYALYENILDKEGSVNMNQWRDQEGNDHDIDKEPLINNLNEFRNILSQTATNELQKHLKNNNQQYNDQKYNLFKWKAFEALSTLIIMGIIATVIVLIAATLATTATIAFPIIAPIAAGIIVAYTVGRFIYDVIHEKNKLHDSYQEKNTKFKQNISQLNKTSHLQITSPKNTQSFTSPSQRQVIIKPDTPKTSKSYSKHR